MYLSMFILILNTIFVFARPADDAVTGATPNDRTQQDQQIDDECAPRMAQGVDHYAACVAEKGRAAEQERQRRLEAQRMMEINEGPQANPETEVQCSPGDAVKACASASERAMLAVTNRMSETALVQAMQSCRAACNAESAQVLRQFLGGCRNIDLRSTKQAMLHTMNNCGTSSVSSSPSVPEGISEFFESKMSLSDKLNVVAFRATGYAMDPTAGTTNSFAQTSGTELSGGVRYMQVTGRDGSVSYQYCSVDNSCHTNYDAAAAASAPLLVRSGTYGARGNPSVSAYSASALPGAAFDPLAGGRSSSELDPVPNAEAARPQLAFPESIQGENSPGVTADPEGLSMGVETPRARATPNPNPARVAGGDGAGGTNGSTTGDDSQQQVVTPISNEPVSYQAGNFAGLQGAMNTPPGGGMASSSSYGGEVSRGSGSDSGGSSSGGYSSGSSRPLAFEGSGQVSPTALRANDTPASVPSGVAGGASAASLDVAAPGGGSRGGGLGDFGGGGRMFAAARTGPASLESSMSGAMRSDSYYRTPGARGGSVAARPGARPATACKGPSCRRAARPRGIAAANCDGNPQCLLALTGKLRAARERGTGQGEVWEDDNTGLPGARAVERGLASVPQRPEPGGVVRGKVQDVLNHLGSSSVFKLDHDGMLEVGL